MKLQLLVIGAGGFVGAIARYGLSGFIQHRMGSGFPMGTLGVNVLGCLVIGVLATLSFERSLLSPTTRNLLLTGLLGSFTTFSTFGYETLALLRGGEAAAAFLNAGLNVLLGVAAVAVGVVLGRFL